MNIVIIIIYLILCLTMWDQYWAAALDKERIKESKLCLSPSIVFNKTQVLLISFVSSTGGAPSYAGQNVQSVRNIMGILCVCLHLLHWTMTKLNLCWHIFSLRKTFWCFLGYSGFVDSYGRLLALFIHQTLLDITIITIIM